MRYFVPQREKRDLTPEEFLFDTQGEIARRLEKPIERRNFFFFAALLGIGMALLLFRVFWFTILRYDTYARIAESNRTELTSIPAERGIVYERNGIPLMHNVPVLDLLAYPQELPIQESEKNREVLMLAELLGLSANQSGDLGARLATTSSKPYLVAEHIDNLSAIAFAVRQTEFPGIHMRLTPSRVYTDAEAMYHLIGFLGRATKKDIDEGGYLASDLLGKSGVEASYEAMLRGVYGHELYEVDAHGSVVRLLSRSDPKEGDGVVLGIDGKLQAHAYRKLSEALRRHGSSGGAVVAIDPRNGRILALVSAPSVDANLFVSGISQEAYQKILQDPRHPFFNRAIAARYPAGSTIKPFLGAAALAEAVVVPQTVIQDAGAITIPDVYNPSVVYTFRGYATLGPVDMARAIALSSDIYFYTIGGGYGPIRGLGAERIETYLQKFGFGKTLGIDILGEDEGLIPSPAYKEAQKGEKWRIGDTYNISIGQGDMGVTPLQLAVATAAIANGGTLWKPQLMVRVIDKDFNTLRAYEPFAIRQDVVDPEHIAVIRNAMRETVTYGTARLLQQLPVSVAAKTGTAQTGKISRPHSLVTVFAPYKDPEIVLAIVVEKAGEGGEVAVPLARDILMEYFRPKSE
ncbi:MAG: penicillin-binding protein 2 [bacterium]|nr:penicillin-binding protein 2 [bacterium]